MPNKEELAELFSNPEYGALMAGVLLVALLIAGYYVKKWLQSIEDTRKAVFGSNETKGLKTRVNVLEVQRSDDRKDIDLNGVKIDRNHEQVLEHLKSLTKDISSNSEKTSKQIGEILGYLKGKEKGTEEEQNRRADD
jgi:hypothetical protein